MSLPVILLASALAQAPHPEHKGEIRGRCLQAGSDEPVAGITVELRGREQEGGQRSARTAADGSFAFERLAPGTFELTARKTGWLPAAGFPVEVKLEAGQSRTGLQFRFRRHGAIAGRVLDPEGEPVIGATVIAWRDRWLEGRRILQRAASATTDDRGHYRLFGLTAASFTVGAVAPQQEPAPGELEHSATIYHPSASSAAEAGRLRLAWGQDLAGTDLVMRPQPGYSISGVIADAQTGGPCRTCTLRIRRLEDAGAAVLASSGVRADGSYRASGLPLGTYRIVAEKAAPEGGRHLVSLRTVTLVNQSVRDAHLVAGIDREVTGRVALESPPEGFKAERGLVLLFDGLRFGSVSTLNESLEFRFRAESLLWRTGCC